MTINFRIMCATDWLFYLTIFALKIHLELKLLQFKFPNEKYSSAQKSSYPLSFSTELMNVWMGVKTYGRNCK